MNITFEDGIDEIIKFGWTRLHNGTRSHYNEMLPSKRKFYDYYVMMNPDTQIGYSSFIKLYNYIDEHEDELPVDQIVEQYIEQKKIKREQKEMQHHAEYVKTHPWLEPPQTKNPVILYYLEKINRSTIEE